jgi:hypothetical protein
MEGNSAVAWRKSSYSGNNGGDCLEVGNAASLIAVRDSKVPNGARLAFGRAAWEAFAARVKAGAGAGVR